MKIYFIRHGETIECLDGIILGSLPYKLSSNGIKEAKIIGKFLLGKGLNISKILTSNLDRSIETGKIISNYLKVPIFERFEIRERESGIAEGKKNLKLTGILMN